MDVQQAELFWYSQTSCFMPAVLLVIYMQTLVDPCHEKYSRF